MSRAEVAAVLSALGAAANNCLFLAQLPLIRAFVAKGSSDGYPFLPSAALMLLLTVWSAYTVYVIPTAQLYVANFPGMIIPFLNLVFFTVYASTWQRKILIGSITLVFLAFGWVVPIILFTRVGVESVGILIVLLSLFFFVSPLPALRTAWIEKDASRVPVLLAAVQAVQASIWIAAGVYLGDNFIYGCNSGALITATLQLLSYCAIRLRIHYSGGAVVGSGGSAQDKSQIGLGSGDNAKEKSQIGSEVPMELRDVAVST